MSTGKKLLRSSNRIFAGVCGGIADYFDIDPLVVRIVYTVLTFCTAFCGILLYPILWLIIPSENK